MVSFVLFLPLHVEARHFIVDRFKYSDFDSKAKYAVGKLMLHSRTVQNFVVVLGQAEAPTRESAGAISQIAEPSESLVIIT